MIVRKPYQAIIETKEQLKFVKKLYQLNRLHSNESNRVYYRTRDTGFKLNEKVVIVHLKKVIKGNIIYLANSIYGIGGFYFITTKEFDKLNEMNFSCVSDVNINQWRYLYYFESILSEFKHPLILLDNKEIEIEFNKRSLDFKIERLNEEKTKLLARL